MKLYKYLAKNIVWHKRITNNKIIDDIFKKDAENNIKKAIDLLPHGSGIDSDYTIDFEKSNSTRIIISTVPMLLSGLEFLKLQNKVTNYHVQF